MSQQQKPSAQQDRPSFGDRVRYNIDLFLSWSPVARFVGLFAVSLFLVMLCAILVLVVGGDAAELEGNFLEAMWWALGRVADAGTMTDDKGTLVRAVAVFATLCGVMVVALLIGLVSSTVADKIEDLRRGKSPVIDEGHTLILGYGEKVFPILRELREANMSRKRATIVILSSADKQEVEEAVAERMSGMGTTRVVVRQGSSFSVRDLRKVGAGRARSIIILSSDVGAAGDAEASVDPDMNAIKTLLALRRVPGALTNNHAVVELIDTARVSVIERLGNGGVEVVAMRETLARLMVQTSRQTGLAGVYRDLLTFNGSELYIKGFPELAGMRFGDVFPVLRNAVPLGIRRPRPAGQGPAEILINPNPDTKLVATDELLVLAEDDDSFGIVRASPLPAPKNRAPGVAVRSRRPERILVCGSPSDLGAVIADFDRYVSEGSEIHVMAGPGRTMDAAAESQFKNLTVVPLDGDPTSLAAVREATEMGYDAILHLADDKLSPSESDATTVLSILMLRDAFDRMPRARRPRMVSEILDTRTKELIATDDVSDFVVSSEITSMLLAQVSEQRELNRVFADMFDANGNEIYLKSAERYAPIGEPVAWLSVQRMAQSHGEIAVGCYRPGMSPVLNPPQAGTMTFRSGDKIVVVAEDDQESVGGDARHPERGEESLVGRDPSLRSG